MQISFLPDFTKIISIPNTNKHSSSHDYTGYILQPINFSERFIKASLEGAGFLVKLLDCLLYLFLFFNVLFFDAIQFLKLSFQQFIFLFNLLQFYALGLIGVRKLIQAHRQNTFEGSESLVRQVGHILFSKIHSTQILCKLPQFLTGSGVLQFVGMKISQLSANSLLVVGHTRKLPQFLHVVLHLVHLPYLIYFSTRNLTYAIFIYL